MLEYWGRDHTYITGYMDLLEHRRVWCLGRGMFEDLPWVQVEVETDRGKMLNQSWIEKGTTLLHMIWTPFSPVCAGSHVELEKICTET